MLCRIGRHFSKLQNKLQQKQPGVCCSGDVRVARHQDSLRITARSQQVSQPNFPQPCYTWPPWLFHHRNPRLLRLNPHG